MAVIDLDLQLQLQEHREPYCNLQLQSYQAVLPGTNGDDGRELPVPDALRAQQRA